MRKSSARPRQFLNRRGAESFFSVAIFVVSILFVGCVSRDYNLPIAMGDNQNEFSGFYFRDGLAICLSAEDLQRVSKIVRRRNPLNKAPEFLQPPKKSLYLRTIKTQPNIFELQYDFWEGFRYVQVRTRFDRAVSKVIDHGNFIEFVDKEHWFELEPEAQNILAGLLRPFDSDEQEKKFFLAHETFSGNDWRTKIESWVETDKTLDCSTGKKTCVSRAIAGNPFSDAIAISPRFFDFGEMTEIERPVLTATLRNGGDRTVHVTDVIRTCVCANLELSTTNLPPGGSAEVRCTLDPNVFSGPFLKTFFIKTDDPATPSITVPIRGSVRQLWEVSPDKWYQMRAGETNAVLRVKAAPDAPALVRTEILGPDGASFELRPAGEHEFDAVFAPGDQPRGQHHWTVNLYPEGAETPALGLHLGKQVGEHWKCVPARLRAPVNGRDFVADLLVKPADGKDLPADVDPAAITLSPVWDHVSIEPLGPPTWRGIPLRLTVGAEMVSSWEFPKTFYLTIPDHGVASVYFEKIVPPTDAANQPGEKK